MLKEGGIGTGLSLLIKFLRIGGILAIGLLVVWFAVFTYWVYRDLKYGRG